MRDFNTTPAGQWSPGTTEPVDLARTEAFRIGAIDVIPCELSLNRAGQSIHLEPKVMQVLLAFAREPGRVLSRDDLIEIVWEGRIVGDASINRALSQLRAALAELGDESVQIETLPKVGYRLVIDSQGVAVSQVDGGRDERQLFSFRWAAALLLILAIAGSSIWFFGKSDQPIERVRLVLMPLEKSASVNELTAIGVEAQLRDQLAQSDDMVVISSGTVSQLAEGGSTPQNIAQTLDADFVVRGEVDTHRASNVLRFSIFSSSSNSPIWFEEFGQPANASSQLLNQSVREIREAVGLLPSESAELPPLSREEFADYVLALGIVRSRNRQSMSTAKQILTRQLEKHGDFVPGLITLARAEIAQLDFMQDSQEENTEVRAVKLLERALVLDPDNAQALGWHGFHSHGDVEERLKMVKRAATLDPGDVRLQLFQAILQLSTGRASEALNTYEYISGLDPFWVRASQAHDMAIELGERDRAAGIMSELRNVVAMPEHLTLLDSAEARAKGDLSRSAQLLLAMQTGQADSFRMTARFHLVGILAYLGLANEPDSFAVEQNPLLQRVFALDLPDRRGMDELGVNGDIFWRNEMMRMYGPALYLRNDQADVLLSFYDDFAESPDDLLAKITNGKFDFRLVAPYLALALREAGRDTEAKQTLKLALEIDKGFTSHGPQNMGELVRSAQLYAVAGRREDAIRNLEKARSMGWPYLSAWLLVYPYLGTVMDDPAFESLRSDPRFRSLATEVEAERQRERAEVLAQKMT